MRLDGSVEKHRDLEDRVTPAAPDFADLLAATSQGDRRAFRQLYDATSPKLLGVILRITRSRAEAEEVLQDAYIRVWNNAGSFSPDLGQPLAWLISIARNRAIDILRVKTPVTLSRDDGETDWIERIADPHDEAAGVADRDALQRCLKTIEPQTREMIVRAYCNGDSREELAQRFARPVNTVKTLLHRGLASLKTCLDERT